jgi:lipoyl(octanoyl) transferase
MGNTKNGTQLEVQWLGRLEYGAAWRLQQELAAQRLHGEIGDTLLLLEHPPTLTLGRGAHREHLLATPEQLAGENITVVEVDRGGDITYHGPGQLVGYPILNLREPPHKGDLHLYLRDLEETLIRSLDRFGIAASRFPGYTGVWTGMDTPTPRKIVAIGIKFSRWITSHGFALNVCLDLSHFDLIVPCGIRDYGVTSIMQQSGGPVVVEEVVPHVVTAFRDVFGYAP